MGHERFVEESVGALAMGSTTCRWSLDHESGGEPSGAWPYDRQVWVQYAPVTLGAGSPLLPRQVELRLEDVVRNRDFACVRYAVLRGTDPAKAEGNASR